MKSPDKYLRKGYLEALQAQGLVAFNKDIPVNISVPSLYVLIESQSKTTTVRSKTDFEWNSRITLHVIKVNTRGYISTSDVDDAEEKCITAIEAGIIVDNFYLKSTYQIDSTNLDITDKTTTVERRVLVYEHWLAEIGLGATGPINPGSGGIIAGFPLKIAAGTASPYFISNSDYPAFGPTSEVIVEIAWIDPVTSISTGRLSRVYDIPVVRQDSNGDGTGTFTGWLIYGHDDEDTFAEDTYISLK